MDPDELDRLEQEQLKDREQTPPFNAGGVSRGTASEPDSDQQFSGLVADHPLLDDDEDETEYYNQGEDHDNLEADDSELPDVDSYEDPAKQ